MAFLRMSGDWIVNHSHFASVDGSSDKPFSFVFGENVVHVHPVLAEFLSPRVSRLRRCDPSVDRYAFQEGSNCAYRAFEEFVSLLRQGKPLQWQFTSIETMLRVAEELENQEIASYLREKTEDLIEIAFDPMNLRDGIGKRVGVVDLTVTANRMDPHCAWPEGLTIGDICDVVSYGPDPWICIDFERCRVAPTAYVMRSGGGNFGHAWPRNWDIEVSHDESEGSWQIIDSRRDFDGFNEPYQTLHFEISDPPRELYRFFRVRETTNPRLYDMLALTHLEIFGTLFLSSDDE